VDLQIDTRHIGDQVVVALGGVADLSTAPLLHQRLRRACVDHPGVTLTVDLDGLVALDDAALGMLLGAAAHAREAGGELQLVCTNERLRERLAVTRLDRCLTVRDDLGDPAPRTGQGLEGQQGA
jgi:anti-sigma B factor antagonist